MTYFLGLGCLLLSAYIWSQEKERETLFLEESAVRLPACSVLDSAKGSCGQGGELGANSSLVSCLLRSQETYLTATVVVLTFLPAPMVLVVVYGFWKKRHMGSK